MHKLRFAGMHKLRFAGMHKLRFAGIYFEIIREDQLF
jgi:hypothetical protein